MPASLLKIPLLTTMAIISHIGFSPPSQATSHEIVTDLGFSEKVFSTAISFGIMGLLRVSILYSNIPPSFKLLFKLIVL
jgi:hypothetical protein